MIPIFSQLKPYLEAARKAASDQQGKLGTTDAEYVVRGKRDSSNCNLRTQFNRILARAEVAPWERLFHNLRASMQMDLAKSYPAHVVANWAGNSVVIGAKHYLMPTEADFLTASGGTVAVEKVAQGGHRTRAHRRVMNAKKPQILERIAALCVLVQTRDSLPNTPDRIRTCNPRFRRPMRYPIAPRVQL